MSALVKSAAHFEVCICKKHGWVVFRDGTRGKDICSVTSGVMEIEQSWMQKRLTLDEMAELQRQIFHSGLPREGGEEAFRDAVCIEFMVS